jgi:hypothetical protein
MGPWSRSPAWALAATLFFFGFLLLWAWGAKRQMQAADERRARAVEESTQVQPTR